MKRILAFLLAIFMLAGCAGKEVDAIEETDEGFTRLWAASDANEDIYKTDFYSSSSGEIYDLLLNDGVLYVVRNEIKSGDEVLSSINAFDINTREEVYSVSDIPSNVFDTNLEIFGDKLYFNAGNGKLMEFSLELEAKDALSFDENTVMAVPAGLEDVFYVYEQNVEFPGTVNANANRKNMYDSLAENDIFLYNAATGEKKNVYPDETKINSCRYQNGKLLVSYYIDVGKCVYEIIDILTGEKESCPIDANGYFPTYENGTWLLQKEKYIRLINSEGSQIFKDNSESKELFGFNLNIYDLIPGTDIFYMLPSDEFLGYDALYLYDTAGNPISWVNTNSMGLDSCVNFALHVTPVWSEENSGFFFSADNAVMFWQIDRDKAGEDMHIMTREEENAQALLERAQLIEEKYGFPISFLNEDEINSSGWLIKNEKDYVNSVIALEQIEKALEVYPEGFFEDLMDSGYKDLEVVICNSVKDKTVPEDAPLDRGIAAFVDPDEKKMYIGASHSFIETTVYHEFSHIIDDVLIERAKNGTGSLSDENWAKLNPEGFSYVRDRNAYSQQFDNKYLLSAFIDDYGMVNETEDRARLMENAMSESLCILNSEEKQAACEKMKYYNKCIREGFDSSSWPEVTAWEKFLQE